VCVDVRVRVLVLVLVPHTRIYFHSMRMQIIGKPGTPEGPLEVKDITKTSCKLSWKKPEDDGGIPIREYEVEKMDMKTGKWVRVGKVAADAPGSPGFGDKPEMIVTGLNPNSEYKFRVKAVNDEGDSEPLISLKPIVAKNPYGTYIICVVETCSRLT